MKYNNKKVNSIVIMGYESTSDSYQKVKIFVNNDLIHSSSSSFYGYENYYEEVAMKYLIDNKVISNHMVKKHDIRAFWNLKSLGITALSFKSMVTNKKLKEV